MRLKLLLMIAAALAVSACAGAKKARWTRALPIDDSLRHLAQSFANEWYPPKR